MAVLNMREGGCPSHAVRVDRQTRHGNRFVIGRDGDRRAVIEKHARDIAARPVYLASLDELRARDLACWCAPLACHGDTLAMLATLSNEERLAWAARLLTTPEAGTRQHTASSGRAQAQARSF